MMKKNESIDNGSIRHGSMDAALMGDMDDIPGDRNSIGIAIPGDQIHETEAQRSAHPSKMRLAMSGFSVFFVGATSAVGYFFVSYESLMKIVNSLPGFSSVPILTQLLAYETAAVSAFINIAGHGYPVGLFFLPDSEVNARLGAASSEQVSIEEGSSELALPDSHAIEQRDGEPVRITDQYQQLGHDTHQDAETRGSCIQNPSQLGAHMRKALPIVAEFLLDALFYLGVPLSTVYVYTNANSAVAQYFGIPLDHPAAIVAGLGYQFSYIAPTYASKKGIMQGLKNMITDLIQQKEGARGRLALFSLSILLGSGMIISAGSAAYHHFAHQASASLFVQMCQFLFARSEALTIGLHSPLIFLMILSNMTGFAVIPRLLKDAIQKPSCTKTLMGALSLVFLLQSCFTTAYFVKLGADLLMLLAGLGALATAFLGNAAPAVQSPHMLHFLVLGIAEYFQGVKLHVQNQRLHQAFLAVSDLPESFLPKVSSVDDQRNRDSNTSVAVAVLEQHRRHVDSDVEPQDELASQMEIESAPLEGRSRMRCRGMTCNML